MQSTSRFLDEEEQRETLTIVVPVYNEEACLPELFDRLLALQHRIAPRSMDVVLINDGSTDGTPLVLDEAATLHPFIRIIHLSRNFGHQAALSAGLDLADGDFVCIIDADLQDPPEVIPEMLRIACEGNDIVYGQRRTRRGETLFKKATAAIFYRLLRDICGVDVPKDAGDFRLMRKSVVLAFRSMRENHRFIRGMIAWVGFRSVPFLYDRHERYAGKTKYPLLKMAKFATDAIVSFSNLPLRISTYFGFAMTVLAMVGMATVVVLRLFTAYTVPGISAVLFVICLIGGIQFLILGAIGEYISRIYEQTKQRPLYVVSSTRNIRPR
jgi:glycosyltransferase involved in cell wall biosynthesis